MLRRKIQLRALTILCNIAGDEIRQFAPNHPLLIYQDRTLPEPCKQRLLVEFFRNYGPVNMNSFKPSDGDIVESFRTYYALLLAALAIEQAKHLLKLR